MKQELFYVAASRGSEGISIVTSDVERLSESLGVSMARPSAIELANDIAQQKGSPNQDIGHDLKQELKLPIKTQEIGFEMGLGF
jgi:predicted RNA-binding protein with PIN domain